MKYIFLFLFLSCNEKYPPNPIELCTSNEGNLVCNDLRKKKKEQTYERPYKAGDICTNAEDYSQSYNYCADLRERLIKTEKKVK